MISQWLMKLGIPTFTDTYFTLLPTTATQQIKIGQDMPTPVGWIYGISLTTGGSHPTDPTQPIITSAQAPNVYIYFKIATDLYMHNFRLDNYMMFSQADNQMNNQLRYLPVSIPAATDLKESYYLNPTGITSTYVPLTIHYISLRDYRLMLAKNLMHNLINLPAQQHPVNAHGQHNNPHNNPHVHQ